VAPVAPVWCCVHGWWHQLRNRCRVS